MPCTYWLERAVLVRALAFIYFVAFAILAFQAPALIGEHGLLPASDYLSAVRAHYGGSGAGFWHLPSLFWLSASDAWLSLGIYLGLALSMLALAGFGNAPLMFALWALYLSFVHVGQVFYGYGWDSLLCESGFLAIFLAPAWRPRLLDERNVPPFPVIVLARWLTFRLMFGAGLIKIRGDHCWSDLTCLTFHYETQPNPSPLSWYFHHLPRAVHQAGVLFNHFVELVVPFGLFGPRRLRLIAVALTIVFQVILILSGNLSFLNWLTIVIAISALDDDVFARWAPERVRRRLHELRELAPKPSRVRVVVVWAYVVIVALLSLNPLVNLLSSRQRMNASFEPFQLVNTYGAFGSVGRVRHEVVLEGTSSASVDDGTVWKEYEFPCKPGRLDAAPCLITPYHYRLSWQLWFAGFGDFRSEPWILNLVYKLLRGESAIKSQISLDPFPTQPPKFVRARSYVYRFTSSHKDGKWWERELEGEYLHPLSLQHRDFRTILERQGWLRK